MSDHTFPTSGPLPSDSEAMKRALKILNDSGIWFCRPTRYQIKSGNHNFYPDKGTIYTDGQFERSGERGAEAFVRLVKAL